MIPQIEASYTFRAARQYANRAYVREEHERQGLRTAFIEGATWNNDRVRAQPAPVEIRRGAPWWLVYLFGILALAMWVL